MIKCLLLSPILQWNICLESGLEDQTMQMKTVQRPPDWSPTLSWCLRFTGYLQGQRERELTVTRCERCPRALWFITNTHRKNRPMGKLYRYSWAWRRKRFPFKQRLNFAPDVISQAVKYLLRVMEEVEFFKGDAKERSYAAVGYLPGIGK